MEIFDESEFEGLNASQIQKLGAELQQRFAQRRAYFHQVRNSPFIPSDIWNDLNKEVIKFDQGKFKIWNQKWSTISRQQNAQQFITYFNEGKTVFSEIEELIKSIKPEYEHSESVEELKSEILDKVDADINSLSVDIKGQVSDGIQNLIELKAEYKLQDTFATSIKSERDNSKKTKNFLLYLFVVSILLIPTYILLSFNIDKLNNLDTNLQWAVRITFSITLGILSIFLFNQYKVYQLINLKYTHLYNFIGGGATFISELIGLEGESKQEFNKKLADMFIDIDDIMSSIKKSKHPTEKITELSTESITAISKNVTEAAKIFNKSS